MSLPNKIKYTTKRGQCRFCSEIHPFPDLLQHEAVHRFLEDDTKPEGMSEPGTQVIKKEPENVEVMQTQIEPLRTKLVDSRTIALSAHSQINTDGDIRERIRNYDWTKDFQKIYSEDGKITYKCKICSFRRSEQKFQLLHHTFVHTGERPYQCSHCPKKFNQPANKRVHEYLHTGERKYKCSLCTKAYNQSSNLSNHMKSHSSKMPGNKKNVQTNKAQNDIKNEVLNDVILCLDRVNRIKKYSHLYSQALKRLNSSLPGGFKEGIGAEDEMDLNSEYEIKCPELPYKCILCSERFGEPMELYNHRKIHFSNGVGPRKDASRNDEPEIPESSSSRQTMKTEEIEIFINPMDMLKNPIKVEPLGDNIGSSITEEPSPQTLKDMFGVDLSDSRSKIKSDNSQMDLDAEINERIRNYDWTKDFHQAIEKNNGNSRRKVAYICKICSSSNVRKDRLLLHTFIHSGERPFHCKICPMTFTFPNSRKTHEIIHTGKRPFKCHKCSQDFTNPKQLSRHKKSHFSKLQVNKKNVNTNVKGYGVAKNVILCLDRVEQTKEHAHLYSQAFKRLKSSLPEGIQGEKAIETGMTSGTKFLFRTFRTRAQKYTNYGNSYVDPDAEIKERISKYDWIKDFKKISAKDGNIAYKCKICSFRPMRLSNYCLFHHTLVHTGERLYRCQMCPKRFKRPEARIVHERIHSGQRPFKCQICIKDFRDPSSFSRHKKYSCKGQNLKKATLIKTPKCQNISAIFAKFEVTQQIQVSLIRVDQVEEYSQVYNQALERLLNGALQIGVKDKQLEQDTGICHSKTCKICLKEFKRFDNLKRHIKNVHFGIQVKSTCRFCGKKISNQNLHDHEESYQWIKLHICSICSKGFSDITHHSEHLKKVHSKGNLSSNGKQTQDDSPLIPDIKKEILGTFTVEDLLELDIDQAINNTFN